MRSAVITGVIVALVLMVGGCATPAPEIQQPSSESSSFSSPSSPISFSSPSSPTSSPTLVMVSGEEESENCRQVSLSNEFAEQSENLKYLQSYKRAKVALSELDRLQAADQTSDILSQEQALINKINGYASPWIQLEIDAAGQLKSAYGNDIKSMIAKYDEERMYIRNSMDQHAEILNRQLQEAQEEMRKLLGETP